MVVGTCGYTDRGHRIRFGELRTVYSLLRATAQMYCVVDGKAKVKGYLHPPAAAILSPAMRFQSQLGMKLNICVLILAPITTTHRKEEHVTQL